MCKRLTEPPRQHRSRHSSPEPSLAASIHASSAAAFGSMPLPSVAKQGRLGLLPQEQLCKTPGHLTGFLTQDTVCSGAPPQLFLFFFLCQGASTDALSLSQCWPGRGKTQTHQPSCCCQVISGSQTPGSNAVGSEHITSDQTMVGVGAGPCQALVRLFPAPAMFLRPLKLLWPSVRRWGWVVREEQVSHPQMTQSSLTQSSFKKKKKTNKN